MGGAGKKDKKEDKGVSCIALYFFLLLTFFWVIKNGKIRHLNKNMNSRDNYNIERRQVVNGVLFIMSKWIINNEV